MPNDNTVALTQAASELAGQSINAWSAAQTNRKQRQWQEMMYAKQRGDALSDWEMQNQYNSPQEQMARLKAAGLNPNLVYGNGGATAMSSQSVRSSSPGQWSPRPIEVHPSQVVMSYYQQKMQEAAIRNLDTKNTVLLSDAALKAGQLDKLRVDTTKSKTETASISQLTGQRTQLLPILMEQIKANISRMGAQTGVLESDKALKDVERLKVIQETSKSKTDQDIAIKRLKLETITTSQNIRESAQRILNLMQAEATNETEQIRIRAMTRSQDVETRIKLIEEQYLKGGHRPGDKWVVRTMEDFMQWLQKGAKPPGASRQQGEGGFNN